MARGPRTEGLLEWSASQSAESVLEDAQKSEDAQQEGPALPPDKCPATSQDHPSPGQKRQEQGYRGWGYQEQGYRGRECQARYTQRPQVQVQDYLLHKSPQQSPTALHTHRLRTAAQELP